MEASTLPSETSETAAPPTGQPQVRDPERFTGHRVRLHLFEGPCDLLLYLIRAHRYDVFDIPIQQITEQFLEYLRLMDEVDLEYAGDFLVTAATLMQIKSRMLLPKQESENEEEMEEEQGDPRRELVARLLEYQRLQEAADTLKGMREMRAQMFTRPPLLEENAGSAAAEDAEQAAALLFEEVSTFDLLRALKSVLDRVVERPVAIIRREPFTLAERMRGLVQRVARSSEGATFTQLCDDCESRLEVVITFLALLELIRRGRLLVSQPDLFEEIWIKIK
ncbi:MAG: segregation/condensation protein A [Armatimonadota bacterium]|nr:segregation/condensation protein A [Armatimonadota bacterium]